MSKPSMDRKAAAEFLRWRYGDQPMQVVYSESWRAEEVLPDQLDALLDRVGDARFYFPPCDLRPSWGGTTPKPEDVVGSQFVWFDFDAEPFGEADTEWSHASDQHYAEENGRISKDLDAAWQRLGIEPSYVGHSGAGLQGLIRLDRTIPPAHAEELSRKLAHAIGSDTKVFNRNRVLRVPGSVNPKTEHGRRPKQTTLWFVNDKVTTVEDLEAALAKVEPPTGTGSSGKRKKLNINQDAARDLLNTFTVESLRARGVDEHALVLLDEGDVDKEYIDQKGRTDNNRVLLAIARGLWVAGLSPEECAGVLGTVKFPGCLHVKSAKNPAGAWRRVTRAIEKVAGETWAEQQLAARRAAGEPVWRDMDTKIGIFPQPTLANAVIAIKALGIECRLDLFHDAVLITCNGTTAELSTLLGEFSDKTIRLIRSYVNNQWKLDLGEKNILDGIMELALANAYDPVLDYLDGLKWDGVPRLDRAAVTYFNAADTPLNCGIISTALVASVRRARQPGSKFDSIPVLESDEGFFKSSAIRTLYGPENYCDQPILGVSDREAQEQLAGVWGYEIADLAGMARAEVERVKAFASRQVDSARPAYGRVVKKQPRRCVPWGTTNDFEYLQAQNGNRRFWPVQVLAPIDLKKLADDRDQLWAEAAEHESKMPRDVDVNLDRGLWAAASEAQEQRRVKDPWEDTLATIPQFVERNLNGFVDRVRVVYEFGRETDLDRQQRISTKDLLEHVLRKPTERQTDSDAKRLSRVMRRLGWQKSKGIIVIGEDKARGFFRPHPDAPRQGSLAVGPGETAYA